MWLIYKSIALIQVWCLILDKRAFFNFFNYFCKKSLTNNKSGFILYVEALRGRRKNTMGILIYIAKKAYHAYRTEWVNENPYAYVHGVEKPESFTYFVNNIFYDVKKAEHYIFYFSNLSCDEAEEKEDRQIFNNYLNLIKKGRIPENEVTEMDKVLQEKYK